MHPIIALWSHPRSMSTATERVMRERGDLACFHEPFMYDYYVNRKVRSMPHFDIDEGHPVSYDEVRDMLLEKARSGPVFIKDMSYYVMPHILEDKALSGRLVNCFLIRDPMAAIVSYYKLDPDLTCEEIGIEAQSRHYAALRAAGQSPVVILAEDLRADVRRTMAGFWQKIGLPPADHAFEWASEKPQDWNQVQGWHGDVSASTAIRPLDQNEIDAQKEKFAASVRQRPQLQAFLDLHIPHYETLRAEALRP